MRPIRQQMIPVAAALVILTAGAVVRGDPEPALRLFVLDCGKIDVLDISFFQPGIGEGEGRTLPNPCYLVIHPEGSLLWDAGLPDALAAPPAGDTVLGAFVLHVTRPLAEQLREIDHAPESIRYLGLSHMHFDHVGNVNLFPRATLLLQEDEYDAAFGPEPGKYFFDPSTYSSLRRNPVEKLAGDHDVFGDGTVVIKRAPGHTPGHQALFVKLAETGDILLSGDLVHYTENWVYRRVPGSNFDREQTVRTMDEIADFLEESGATLWIQHDPDHYAKARHAPDYYE